MQIPSEAHAGTQFLTQQMNDITENSLLRSSEKMTNSNVILFTFAKKGIRSRNPDLQ